MLCTKQTQIFRIDDQFDLLYQRVKYSYIAFVVVSASGVCLRVDVVEFFVGGKDEMSLENSSICQHQCIKFYLG